MPKHSERLPNHYLRDARLHAGWTQRDLADRLGTTALTIGRWERREMVPGSHFRHKLCALFSKSAEELGFLYNEQDKKEERQETRHISANQEGVAASLPLWTLPYRRNPFFTGRQALLARLHRILSLEKKVAVTQLQAICGLGGIGKTQVVIEYAYHFRDEYFAVLWLRAETRDVLMSDIATLADALKLPEKDRQDQSQIVRAVKRWLEDSSNWLLILDNVEDFHILADVLPSQSKGHTLLTTRAQATGTLACPIIVEQMEPDEGALFLLRRAKFLRPDALLQEVAESLYLQARDISQVLDGLPLALDQAGAYIEESGCSLSDYLTRYQTQQTQLLHRRGSLSEQHADSVSTTFSLCFEKVGQANPAAAELLKVCAFLAADAIPEEIIFVGGSQLGSLIQQLAADPVAFDDALAVLRKYSLLNRQADAKLFHLHRLVQAVLINTMDENVQSYWAERAVRAVHLAFPDAARSMVWDSCRRCLPHALVCTQLIDRWDMNFPQAAHLLHQTAMYLLECGQYAQAERLLTRAIGISTRTEGPEHPSVAEMLNDLGALHRNQGHYPQAESLLQRALMIREKILGSEHPDVAESLNDLGVLYRSQGHYTQAVSAYHRALSIKEKTLGPDHLSVALSLSNLGVLYNAQCQYEQAEPLLQRALSIRKKALGPEHPNVANSLNHLGFLANAQGQYDRANHLYQTALMIWEKMLGPEHPHVAICLNNLGMLSLNTELYAQAEAYFRRAHSLQEKILGSNHPRTIQSLHSLALLYMKQGKDEQAEALLRQTLMMREQQLSAEHPDVAISLHDLATLYLKQAEYGQAKPLFERALALRESKLGAEHPDTVAAREHYLYLLQVMKQEGMCES